MYRRKPGRPKKFDSKNCVVTVRLNLKEMARLRALSEEKDMSISSVIRMLINEYWSA